MVRELKKHLKRLNAPKRWMLDKLGRAFAPKPLSGPQKSKECLSLIPILCNRMRYALTYGEVIAMFMLRHLLADGKVRIDKTYPAGFMDVVSIPKTNKNFRLLYDTKGHFHLHSITDEEAKHLDEENIADVVSLESNVDGFRSLNMGNLPMNGREPLFTPCAPKACIEVLLRHGMEIMAKRAVGRSKISGLPTSLLMQKHYATVSVAHELTTKLDQITCQSDSLVSDVGMPNMVRGNWLKRGRVVIGVGANQVVLSEKCNYQQSRYRKEVSLAALFIRYGFTSSQLHSFLSQSRFLLDSSIDELDKSLRILISFRIPQKSMVYLISNSPEVLEFQFLKKWEISFSKLGTFGAITSPLIICNVLKHCRRFHVDPDDFLKDFEALRVLGFSDTVLNCLLESYPGVIMMSKAELVSAIEFLKGIEISSNGIERVIRSFPEVLGLGVEDKLKPLLNEFRDLGFSVYEIKETIVREPRVLGMELGELSRCLQLLNGLKCRMSVKEKIFGEGMLKAGLEVKRRVDCLCSYGLIRREAFKILWKEPRVIIYEVEDVKKKLDFLLHSMKYSIDCLTDVPEYLGVNFEKQIIPRHNIMEHLKAKEAIAFEVGLRDLVKPSRLRFYNLYVKPYPECEKIYGRFSESAHVKRKHPVGLWKLFKPRKDPESREDVANMKSFMEAEQCSRKYL